MDYIVESAVYAFQTFYIFHGLGNYIYLKISISG